MIMQKLISEISRMEGNLNRGKNVYISAPNMDCFANHLSDVDAKQGILITPYLVAYNSSLYELHYYEFDIEVRGNKSYYVDYNVNNVLPDEITERLKPQAIVAQGDIDFYIEAVIKYLSNMKAMKFEEDKAHYPELQGAGLFYQLFIASDS